MIGSSDPHDLTLAIDVQYLHGGKIREVLELIRGFIDGIHLAIMKSDNTRYRR
jgi:hypothetical protein